jgi:hypothetical protein
MNKKTVTKLNKEVCTFKPDIPYYVYRLTNETVNPENGAMVSRLAYSINFLSHQVETHTKNVVIPSNSYFAEI